MKSCPEKKSNYNKEEVKNVMCKIGDIILIERYKDREKTLGRHSFVVVDDKDGEIQGLPYDIICNVFSSFKSEEQKKRKLSYSGNYSTGYSRVGDGIYQHLRF